MGVFALYDSNDALYGLKHRTLQAQFVRVARLGELP